MKRVMKILAGITAIVMIMAIIWTANGLLGNPVSKMLAENAAKNYIAENYGNKDLVIEEISYSFKSAAYHAYVKSPSSVDTYFSLTISMLGEVKYDTYENILEGWNTYQRIEEAYRQIVNEAFISSDFPFISNINFGTIELIDIMEEDKISLLGEENYGVKLDELELDKAYDVKELARTAGHIVFYAQDDEISFEKASEILLSLKEILDEAEIPFYAIDFVLEKPHYEDGTPNEDGRTINTAQFLYSDIYEEGLTSRLEKAHNTLMAYYAEQDAKGKY